MFGKTTTLEQRLRLGHQLIEGDVEGVSGAEMCERFLMLDELDQEKFWANVAAEAYHENWVAGGPGEWGREPDPPRPVPRLNPPSPSADVLSLEKALGRLRRVRPRKNEWTACCPAHDDRSPSLVISESRYKPGEPVFFCHAGCTHRAVKEAVEALP